MSIERINRKVAKLDKSIFHLDLEKQDSKMNEAMVSLRVMRQIDDYLTYLEMTNREFADRLEVNESYISQLMTGTRRVNIAFLNKIEEVFNVKFIFKIDHKKTSLSMTQDEFGRYEFKHHSIDIKKESSEDFLDFNASGDSKMLTFNGL